MKTHRHKWAGERLTSELVGGRTIEVLVSQCTCGVRRRIGEIITVYDDPNWKKELWRRRRSRIHGTTDTNRRRLLSTMYPGDPIFDPTSNKKEVS